MLCPSVCEASWFRDVASACWREHPEERPSFGDLVATLEPIAHEFPPNSEYEPAEAGFAQARGSGAHLKPARCPKCSSKLAFCSCGESFNQARIRAQSANSSKRASHLTATSHYSSLTGTQHIYDEASCPEDAAAAAAKLAGIVYLDASGSQTAPTLVDCNRYVRDTAHA
jgi:hypothetical protein